MKIRGVKLKKHEEKRILQFEKTYFLYCSFLTGFFAFALPRWFVEHETTALLWHFRSPKMMEKFWERSAKVFSSKVGDRSMMGQSILPSFKNPHIKINPLPRGPKSIKLLYSIMNLNTIISLPFVGKAKKPHERIGSPAMSTFLLLALCMCVYVKGLSLNRFSLLKHHREAHRTERHTNGPFSWL